MFTRIVAVAEKVNHPDHYGGDTPHEVIKCLEAWLTPEEFLGFLKGNAIKYLSRLGRKGNAEAAITDAEKGE